MLEKQYITAWFDRKSHKDLHNLIKRKKQTEEAEQKAEGETQTKRNQINWRIYVLWFPYTKN